MRSLSGQTARGSAPAAPGARCRAPGRELPACGAQAERAAQTQQQSRRALVGGGLTALLLAPVQQAQASFGWDGSSAATGSCALGDDGAECRRAALRKDNALGTTAYPGAEQRSAGPQAITTGVPIAEMTDEYSVQTAALTEVVERYFTLDPYDPERTKLVKAIKTDGAAWASKYARGGSARKQSARKMYIVIDSIQGHITSNGFAPLPPKKVQTLQANLNDARALLAKGA